MSSCVVNDFSSRVCEYGTKCCVVEHGTPSLRWAARLILRAFAIGLAVGWALCLLLLLVGTITGDVTWA